MLLELLSDRVGAGKVTTWIFKGTCVNWSSVIVVVVGFFFFYMLLLKLRLEPGTFSVCCQFVSA